MKSLTIPLFNSILRGVAFFLLLFLSLGVSVHQSAYGAGIGDLPFDEEELKKKAKEQLGDKYDEYEKKFEEYKETYKDELANYLREDPAIKELKQQIEDLQTNVLQPLTAAGVQVVGLGLDHRPYEPATGLNVGWGGLPKAGISFGLELSLVKIPTNFGEQVNKAGIKVDASKIPFLPAPKLHFHKGILDRFDVGVSGIGFKGFYIVGGHAKLVLIKPEQGPLLAIRVGYNYANVKILKTKTITPAIVLSKKVFFVDPYIGMGYQYATGEIKLPVPIPDALKDIAKEIGLPSELKATAKAQGAFFFAGFPISITPLKLTIEMASSRAGATYFGLKMGLEF